MNDDFDKGNITLKTTETFSDYGEDLQAKMQQHQGEPLHYKRSLLSPNQPGTF